MGFLSLPSHAFWQQPVFCSGLCIPTPALRCFSVFPLFPLSYSTKIQALCWLRAALCPRTTLFQIPSHKVIQWNTERLLQCHPAPSASCSPICCGAVCLQAVSSKIPTSRMENFRHKLSWSYSEMKTEETNRTWCTILETLTLNVTSCQNTPVTKMLFASKSTLLWTVFCHISD